MPLTPGSRRICEDIFRFRDLGSVGVLGGANYLRLELGAIFHLNLSCKLDLKRC